jgi:superfamily II DNA or RNA helicase
MQALCQTCNLKKGSKKVMKTYRKHQQDMMKAAQEIAANRARFRMLAHVACGAGKSWLPPILINEMSQNVSLCWVVPRLALQKQAVDDSKCNFGIELRDSGNEENPSRGKRGVVITHQAFSLNPELWKSEFLRKKYVLVIDEPHHAKESRNGELNQLARAISICSPYVHGLVYMTGTLHTSDSRMVHGVAYEQDAANGGEVATANGFDYHIRYSRIEALEDQAIVPIEFFHDDGPVRWESLSTGDETEVTLSQATKQQEGDAIWTALTTELAWSLFERGYKHWKANGNKLLIVCHSQKSAMTYHKELLGRGERSFLAVTDNEDALSDIDKFKRASSSCLVTCAMAYEGLDEKSLSHVIALTHIRSTPWIEQMLARVWRALPGKTKCFAFVPDDPRMNRVIESIKAEQPDVKSAKEGGTCGNGGGSERDAIPIASNYSTTRHTGLDIDVAACRYNDKQQQAFDSLVGLGIDPSSSSFLAIINELETKAEPKANGSLTTSQREKAIRNEIVSICCDRDKSKGRKFGTSQKLLIRRTGKSITLMSEDELRKVLAHVKNVSIG